MAQEIKFTHEVTFDELLPASKRYQLVLAYEGRPAVIEPHKLYLYLDKADGLLTYVGKDADGKEITTKISENAKPNADKQELSTQTAAKIKKALQENFPQVDNLSRTSFFRLASKQGFLPTHAVISTLYEEAGFLTSRNESFFTIHSEMPANGRKNAYILVRNKEQSRWDLNHIDDSGKLSNVIIPEALEKILKEKNKAEDFIENDNEEIKRIIEEIDYARGQEQLEQDVNRGWKINGEIRRIPPVEECPGIKEYAPYHHQSLAGAFKMAFNGTLLGSLEAQSKFSVMVMVEDYKVNTKIEPTKNETVTDNSVLVLGVLGQPVLVWIPGHLQTVFNSVTEGKKTGQKFQKFSSTNDVLKDLFTGKRNFKGCTLEEIQAELEALKADAMKQEAPESLYVWHQKMADAFLRTGFGQGTLLSSIQYSGMPIIDCLKQFVEEFNHFLDQHAELKKGFEQDTSFSENFKKIRTYLTEGNILAAQKAVVLGYLGDGKKGDPKAKEKAVFDEKLIKEYLENIKNPDAQLVALEEIVNFIKENKDQLYTLDDAGQALNPIQQGHIDIVTEKYIQIAKSNIGNFRVKGQIEKEDRSIDFYAELYLHYQKMTHNFMTHSSTKLPSPYNKTSISRLEHMNQFIKGELDPFLSGHDMSKALERDSGFSEGFKKIRELLLTGKILEAHRTLIMSLATKSDAFDEKELEHYLENFANPGEKLAALEEIFDFIKENKNQSSIIQVLKNSYVNIAKSDIEDNAVRTEIAKRGGLIDFDPADSTYKTTRERKELKKALDEKFKPENILTLQQLKSANNEFFTSVECRLQVSSSGKKPEVIEPNTLYLYLFNDELNLTWVGNNGKQIEKIVSCETGATPHNLHILSKIKESLLKKEEVIIDGNKLDVVSAAASKLGCEFDFGKNDWTSYKASDLANAEESAKADFNRGITFNGRVLTFEQVNESPILSQYIPFHTQSHQYTSVNALNKVLERGGFIIAKSNTHTNIEADQESLCASTSNDFLLIKSKSSGKTFLIPGNIQSIYEKIDNEMSLTTIKFSNSSLRRLCTGDVDFIEGDIKTNENILEKLARDARKQEKPVSLYAGYKQGTKIFLSEEFRRDVIESKEIDHLALVKDFVLEVNNFLGQNKQMKEKFDKDPEFLRDIELLRGVLNKSIYDQLDKMLRPNPHTNSAHDIFYIEEIADDNAEKTAINENNKKALSACREVKEIAIETIVEYIIKQPCVASVFLKERSPVSKMLLGQEFRDFRKEIAERPDLEAKLSLAAKESTSAGFKKNMESIKIKDFGILMALIFGEQSSPQEPRDPFSLRRHASQAYDKIKNISMYRIVEFVLEHPNTAGIFFQKRHWGYTLLAGRNFREEVAKNPELLRKLMDAANKSSDLEFKKNIMSLSESTHIEQKDRTAEILKLKSEIQSGLAGIIKSREEYERNKKFCLEALKGIENQKLQAELNHKARDLVSDKIKADPIPNQDGMRTFIRRINEQLNTKDGLTAKTYDDLCKGILPKTFFEVLKGNMGTSIYKSENPKLQSQNSLEREVDLSSESEIQRAVQFTQVLGG